MEASARLTQNDRVAVDFINKYFSEDIKSLRNLRKLYEEQKEIKVSLEKKLSLASSEVPNEIEKAILEAEEVSNTVAELGDRKTAVQNKIKSETEDVKELVSEVGNIAKEIADLERLSKYLMYIQQVEHASYWSELRQRGKARLVSKNALAFMNMRFHTRIQDSLSTDSIEEGVNTFNELKSLYNRLHESQCLNLVAYAKNTTLFWYRILKNKLGSDFEEVLKHMKWPLVAVKMKSVSQANPTDNKEKMGLLFHNLLKLNLPASLSDAESVHPLLTSIQGIRCPILPIQLMIKPLKKRFKYHFYGNKQTNDISKPEWYFTQVLNWIRDHLGFLETRIQPLLVDFGQKDVDARVEFMIGMVTMAMEKMVTDIPEVMNDDHQFSHLVDEALLFDREIRLSYGFSTSFPCSLHVLSESRPFEKWIQIERKFAIEKLDGMMSSPTAWESQYRNIADVDEMKVPECGESFMTLMLTITDRYKPLPYSSHKLQFLDLQLDLLEDFRVRLIQVKDNTHNPLSERYCSILNTAFYISEVLREWSEVLFFLQLQYYKMENSEKNVPESSCEADIVEQFVKSKTTTTDTDIPFGYTTVFEETINLYERLKNDMMKAIVSHVFTDVKARSKPYRDDRWISLPYQKDVSLGLSTSACEMLLVLKDHLLEVGELISKPLFNQYWEELAEHLNKFIYEEVISRNKFNQGGASQLQFDMTRNLFPLFGEYTSRPESYFKDVKEACILLNLNVGSAILLKEVLYEALHTAQKDKDILKKAKAALSDVNVFKLTLDDSELILSLRTNLVS